MENEQVKEYEATTQILDPLYFTKNKRRYSFDVVRQAILNYQKFILYGLSYYDTDMGILNSFSDMTEFFNPYDRINEKFDPFVSNHRLIVIKTPEFTVDVLKDFLRNNRYTFYDKEYLPNGFFNPKNNNIPNISLGGDNNVDKICKAQYEQEKRSRTYSLQGSGYIRSNWN